MFEKSGSLNRIISIPSKTMNRYIFKIMENDKNKATNNSIIKKNSDKYFNNASYSSVKLKNKNKNKTKKLKSYSESNLITPNNKFIAKGEKKTNKCQLLLNERKFGSTANTTKNAFVGPGAYNIPLKEKSNKVSWSKALIQKKYQKKNNYIKKSKLSEEMKLKL